MSRNGLRGWILRNKIRVFKVQSTSGRKANAIRVGDAKRFRRELDRFAAPHGAVSFSQLANELGLTKLAISRWVENNNRDIVILRGQNGPPAHGLSLADAEAFREHQRAFSDSDRLVLVQDLAEECDRSPGHVRKWLEKENRAVLRTRGNSNVPALAVTPEDAKAFRAAEESLKPSDEVVELKRVANEAGVTTATVRQWAEENGCTVRKMKGASGRAIDSISVAYARQFLKHRQRRFVADLVGLLKISDLSRECGVGLSTVKRWAKANGRDIIDAKPTLKRRVHALRKADADDFRSYLHKHLLEDDVVTFSELCREFKTGPSTISRWAQRNDKNVLRIKKPLQGFCCALSSKDGRLFREYVASVAGVFYAVQLIPQHCPTYLKLGFATDMASRLKSHQTACPEATVLRTWPCTLNMESQAISHITRTGCKPIGQEVFDVDSVGNALKRADEFFGQA